MFRLSRRELLAFLLALAVGTVLHVARLSIGETRGLRAAYFAGVDTTASPVFSTVDTEISSRQVQRRWQGAPPVQFSVAWSGSLAVLREGTYTFSFTTDDAGTLTIDRVPVVDQPGRHGPRTDVGRVELSRGPHQIAINYLQDGGASTIELQWAREGARPGAIPGWRLSPRRIGAGTAALWRGIELAAQGAFLVALLMAGRIGLRTVDAAARRRRAPAERGETGDVPSTEMDARARPEPVLSLAALALFGLLAVLHTWPLASDPSRLSRNDNADTMLNEWIIAWVAHQLPRDPLHLFDGNIFYPEPNTLAYSESMIVQGVMAAPVLWLGASPVLAYNLMVIAGFALTGWSMCLVLRRWTGSWTAGLVAGATFAFNAHTLTRIPHLQALHVEFLPLALLALDRLLRDPRLIRGATLLFWFLLQALTSVHLFVFSAFALGAAAAVRNEVWLGERRRRVLVVLAATLGVSVVALLPFLLPYLQVSDAQHFRRSLDVVGDHAATWRDYLSTPSRLHYPLWSYRYFVGTALFPGVLALVLAGLAVGRGVAWKNPRARMLVAIAAVGVLLSFGPRLPGYAALYAALPPLQAIRGVVRFGYLGIVGVSGLAGFGVMVLRSRISPVRWPMVASALVAIAAFESYAAPLGLQPFDGIPSIYRSLDDQAHAIVVEWPFYDGRQAPFHAGYMLNSTAHWRPLLNGYSGFQPASFNQHADMLRGFPDARSLEALRTLAVTHVFVHIDRTSEETLAAARTSDALRLLRAEGSIELYEVKPH